MNTKNNSFDLLPITYRPPRRLQIMFYLRHTLQFIFFAGMAIAFVAFLFQPDQQHPWNLFFGIAFALSMAFFAFGVVVRMSQSYVHSYHFDLNEITVRSLLGSNHYPTDQIESITLKSVQGQSQSRGRDSRIAWLIDISLSDGESIAVARSENGYATLYATVPLVFFPKLVFTPEKDHEELGQLAESLNQAYGLTPHP